MRRALAQARAGVGAVTVVASREGARIYVDGAAVGEAPILDELFLEPGEHEVRARLEGYSDATQEVVARAGEAVKVSLNLLPMPPPAQPNSARPSPRSAPRSVVPGVALGGAAAVGFGVGAGLLALASSKRADTAALSRGVVTNGGSCVPGAINGDSRCATLGDQATAYVTLHNGGVVTLVSSGVVGAAAVLYFVWPRRTAADARLGWTPQLGPGFGGAQLSVNF